MTIAHRAFSLRRGIQMAVRIAEMETVSFKIPDTPIFPDEYRDGTVEVGVWPSVGVMPSVLDRDGGVARLEKWAINNILLGFIEGDYDEEHLRNEEVLIKILSREGKVLLNTFGNR